MLPKKKIFSIDGAHEKAHKSQSVQILLPVVVLKLIKLITRKRKGPRLQGGFNFLNNEVSKRHANGIFVIIVIVYLVIQSRSTIPII